MVFLYPKDQVQMLSPALTASWSAAFPAVEPYGLPCSALPLGSKWIKLPMLLSCTRLCLTSLSS